jgi:histidinol-phosphate phosphatase family protein
MRGPIVEYTPRDFPTGVSSNGAIAFIDRDGVLNIGSPSYINKPEELVILEGAPKSIGDLKRQGFFVCIVTNQSPIMRGLWGSEQLYSIHQKLRELFLQQDSDAHFDMILTCPHRHRDNCNCRKPNPGMLYIADQILRNPNATKITSKQEIIETNPEHGNVNWWNEKVSPKHELDLLVGDRNSDMGAGWAFGVRLFKVPESIGIKSVSKRILDEKDKGDEFSPLR